MALLGNCSSKCPPPPCFVLLSSLLGVQFLDVEVDLERAILRGRTSFWLRHFPTPHGRYDTYPAEIALHCRQSNVKATKVSC